MIKKSSYIILYIICFAFFCLYNILFIPSSFGTIEIILAAVVESIVPYLIIILIMLIINHSSKHS